MIRRSAALRYSKALFNLGIHDGKLMKRLDCFESFLEVLKSEPKLMKVLEAPQIAFEKKKEILEKSFASYFDQRFFHFLFCVLQQGRLKELPQIAREYRFLVDNYTGIWEASIITAVPLDESVEESLKKKLEKVYRKKIKIVNQIDPSIIGGAILVIDNEMIDWSVKGRLKKMKEKLLEL